MSAGPLMRVQAGAATDTGRVRRANEDAHVAGDRVFAVADGMGGHDLGREAASLVAAELIGLAGAAWLTPADITGAVARACEQVGLLAAGERGAPGSTLSGVALCLQDELPCWLVFNVGDSRTYLLREGDLEQVTVDHTTVQALLDAGRISTQEARVHAQRNVINRAIGAGRPGVPDVDLSLLIAGPADRVLVCSDGLTGEVDDGRIAELLGANPEPQAAADALVAEALLAGGRDNVTVVVVDVTELGAHPVGGQGDATTPDLAERERGDTVPSVFGEELA